MYRSNTDPAMSTRLHSPDVPIHWDDPLVCRSVGLSGPDRGSLHPLWHPCTSDLPHLLLLCLRSKVSYLTWLCVGYVCGENLMDIQGLSLFCGALHLTAVCCGSYWLPMESKPLAKTRWTLNVQKALAKNRDWGYLGPLWLDSSPKNPQNLNLDISNLWDNESSDPRPSSDTRYIESCCSSLEFTA